MMVNHIQSQPKDDMETDFIQDFICMVQTRGVFHEGQVLGV